MLVFFFRVQNVKTTNQIIKNTSFFLFYLNFNLHKWSKNFPLKKKVLGYFPNATSPTQIPPSKVPQQQQQRQNFTDWKNCCWGSSCRGRWQLGKLAVGEVGSRGSCVGESFVGSAAVRRGQGG